MGVLGSAFNPPHLGHLVLAAEARWRLGLEEVLLVPTGVAPHKRIEDDPGAEVRLELARRAASAVAGLVASDVEVSRDGPSYAFETLELLREARPGAGVVWLMGADAALGLESWKRPERVADLARLGIAAREGVMRADLDAVLERVGVDLAGGGAVEVEMPAIGISSTQVRERVRSGEPIRPLVPDTVADLVEERGLYRG